MNSWVLIRVPAGTGANTYAAIKVTENIPQEDRSTLFSSGDLCLIAVDAWQLFIFCVASSLLSEQTQSCSFVQGVWNSLMGANTGYHALDLFSMYIVMHSYFA